MVTNSIDLDFIKPNVVIITPNRRLAAFLTECYQQQKLASDCTVWEQPEIYPITTWLDKLWQDFFVLFSSISKRLLTAIEQQFIWEKIILKSKSGALLIEVTSTAKQAMNAWNVLLQWNLPLESITSPLDHYSDPAIFYTWALEYQKQCNAEGWIDFHSMVNVLIKHIAEYNSVLPKTCYLIEHQELSPQYCRLLTVLEEAGVAIVRKELTHTHCSDITVVPIASKDAEYRAVANWARQVWQEEPQTRLGVIVHDLETCRDSVESAFAAQFTEPVYNIAAPKAMSHYALIDMALLLLQLSNNKIITMNELSKLLSSPFIGKAEIEVFKRAKFTTILRNSNEMAFEYSYIIKQHASLPVEHPAKCQELEAIFSKWLEFLETLHGKHLCEYWSDKLRAVLEIWGWPGDRVIDENERQLIVCWESLLQSYQRLDFILKDHDFSAVCKTLQKLAFTTPFLPATDKVAVHVLGTLEAAGLPFDKLWVLGMDSNSWPTVSNPNPFIPISIQRQFNLPRSSPARELDIAKHLTSTFCRDGAHNVIFSFPEMIDELPATASRLIAQFKRTTIEALVPAQGNLKSHFHNKDDWSIGVDKLPKDDCGGVFAGTIMPGGSRTLKLQANCPFWAFAEIRLKAIPMTRATIGLTPAERGELLHGAMAKFWQQACTHEYLLQTPLQAINDLILSCVTEGLQDLQKKRSLTLTSNYMTLETTRLVGLISKWLLYEQQRTPFVVYKVEHQQLCRVGTLNLKIRIDRIDKLATGEIVIIDYKTGKVQVNEWFDERLQEPQLPLYCVATELAPASIAFAIIRPDSTLFKGIANSADLLPDVPGFNELANKNKAPNWNAQCLDWQDKLTTLADELQQGIATVQPIQGATTCRYCNLHALCRIYEKEVIE